MSTIPPALHVAVLLGGTSPEREISLESGEAVTAALRVNGHAVTPIDPRDTDLHTADWSGVDVVFIALHGTFGEDGSVQRILETAGVAFTGSASGPSRLAFSKSAAKERWQQFGVRTADSILVHSADGEHRNALRSARIGYPLVVKPDAQGSSLGVSIVKSPGELAPALALCFEYGEFALMESFIAGREWTVAVIDDEVLPPLRITPTVSFFDFDAKYADESTQHDFGGSAELRELIGTTAQRACRCLQTSCAVRVDLIVDACDRPWVLEVNTVPGFTSHSLLPMAAREAGMTFESLCDRLARDAVTTVTRRAA